MRLKILKAYSYEELEEEVNKFLETMPQNCRVNVHLWSSGDKAYASILYNF